VLFEVRKQGYVREYDAVLVEDTLLIQRSGQIGEIVHRVVVDEFFSPAKLKIIDAFFLYFLRNFPQFQLQHKILIVKLMLMGFLTNLKYKNAHISENDGDCDLSNESKGNKKKALFLGHGSYFSS
jgi:hypothetical protein